MSRDYVMLCECYSTSESSRATCDSGFFDLESSRATCDSGFFDLESSRATCDSDFEKDQVARLSRATPQGIFSTVCFTLFVVSC